MTFSAKRRPIAVNTPLMTKVTFTAISLVTRYTT